MRQLIGWVLGMIGLGGVFKALTMAYTDEVGQPVTSYEIFSHISSMTGEQQGYLLGYFAVSLLLLIVGWNLAYQKTEGQCHTPPVKSAVSHPRRPGPVKESSSRF